MAELKPCPFCGESKNEHLYTTYDSYADGSRWFVRCFKCGSRGPYLLTEQQAIDSWNKRS